MVNNHFGSIAAKLNEALWGQSGEPRSMTEETANRLKGHEEQIAALRDKIKEVRKKMSALQGIAAMTEAQSRQMESYKKEMASYEEQIATIQSQELKERIKYK